MYDIPQGKMKKETVGCIRATKQSFSIVPVPEMKKKKHSICTHTTVSSSTDTVKGCFLKFVNLIEILGNLEIQFFKRLRENKFDGKLRAVIHTKILFI